MSAAAERRFDPANDTHYAISEMAELRLRLVAEASETIALVLAGFDRERAEVSEDAFAPVFHMLSFAIEGALADRAFVCPGKKR
jgi:hypothetical protein